MEFCTVREVRERLRVSRSTVERLLGNGEIKATKVGRAVRIHAASVDEYIKRRVNTKVAA